MNNSNPNQTSFNQKRDPAADARLQGPHGQPHEPPPPNNHPNERPRTIDEALRVLDDAIATGHSDLRDLVTEEFENLKDAISEFAPEMGDALKGVSGEVYERVSAFTQDIASKGQDYARQGMARSREFASGVDDRVRANPWPVIGGIAVGTFALGYLLGTRRQEPEAPVKTQPTARQPRQKRTPQS